LSVWHAANSVETQKELAVKANTFFRLLCAEILTIALVICLFKMIDDRFKAGMIAGGFFVALGAWILLKGLRDQNFRRSATFWAGCAHLFLSALPLLITRTMYSQESFSNVTIMGMTGPVFHRFSTGIYFVMMLATGYDVFRTSRKVTT
jgi:hypothetical protein